MTTAYIAVTPDEFEFPLYITFSLSDFAKRLNMTKKGAKMMASRNFKTKDNKYKLAKVNIDYSKELRQAMRIEQVDKNDTTGLSCNAAMKKVLEMYKGHNANHHNSQNDHSKDFNDIIHHGEDLDNGILYEIATGETIKEL